MNHADDLSIKLQELKNALDTLSPHDFAAWSDWVEGRLTERLRQRQAQGRLSAEGLCDSSGREPSAGTALESVHGTDGAV